MKSTISLLLFNFVVLLFPSYHAFKYLPKFSSNKNYNQIASTTFCQNMFSGIIEDLGVVVSLEKSKTLKLWDGSVGEGVLLTVKSDVAMKEAYIGCSIAVNGVCLTAITLDQKDDLFTVGLAPETLRRSNLGQLGAGNKVNVERALRADGRNSGHFVQGHVDGVGKILNKWFEGESLWVKVAVDNDILKYIVPKGFIAIDGTSLTVCDVDRTSGWFTFMLVAHTQEHVVIPSKILGESVNIEVDVLAKMVEQSVAGTRMVEQFVDKLEYEATITKLLTKIEELSNRINELSSQKKQN